MLGAELQGGEVGADGWARKVLGQQVCRIGGPTDFEEGEVTSTQPFLDPQLTHCEVPDLPYARPSADANCSGTVGIQLQGKVDPQVAGEGLQPDTLCGCLDDTPKLGLPGAEGDRLFG